MFHKLWGNTLGLFVGVRQTFRSHQYFQVYWLACKNYNDNQVLLPPTFQEKNFTSFQLVQLPQVSSACT